MIKAAMNPAELTIPPRKLTPLMAQRIAKSQMTRRAKDLVVYQRTLRIIRRGKDQVVRPKKQDKSKIQGLQRNRIRR
jgi:cytochrome c-type biogenesis protein CcmH/NrfG